MSTNDFTPSNLSTHERAMSTQSKCVGYIRVSTGKQDCSMEMQEERIKQYCLANGMELDELIYERAVTAKVKLDKRPEGWKLATNTFLGMTPARHIVALKLDRLFRNAVDALTHVEEWQRAGISLHLVDLGGQSVNTESSIGMMLLTVLAGFAEFERNVIAERTTAALRHKKAAGEVYNHPPYGYDAKDGSWSQTSLNSG